MPVPGLMNVKRILVVDDEEDTRLFVAELLQGAGYAVDLAADGGEALRKAEETRPHLIVLDLLMPTMTGWEVLEQLRAGEAPPIVVLSAFADRERALAEGAAGCLSKPFDFGELLATCEQALWPKGLKHDNRR